MFEHFLTDLLKIVIVLDVLGVVAYFLLGAFKAKSVVEPTEALHAEPFPSQVPLVSPSSLKTGRFGELRGRLAMAASKLPGMRGRSRRSPALAESMDVAFSKLNRVLHSYREGLA